MDVEINPVSVTVHAWLTSCELSCVKLELINSCRGVAKFSSSHRNDGRGHHYSIRTISLISAYDQPPCGPSLSFDRD